MPNVRSSGFTDSETKPRYQRISSDPSACKNSTIKVQINAKIGVWRRCYLLCRQTARTPKFWMAFTASTWGFLSSVERAVILPTLWLYLKIYWSPAAASTYYGIVMAAFSLSILITTPLYGYASYYGVRVRTLLLVANLFEITGNLVYLFAQTPMAVLVGRLISGIGASCEPPLYADIARATHKDERTSYIIVLLLSRQIGLVFGPSFTLLMDKLDYHVAKFTLSVYNGPGLLMACLWLLHSFIIVLSYPNVDSSGRLVVPDSHSSCGLCDKEAWISTGSNYCEDHVPVVIANENLSIKAVGSSLYCTYSLLTLYTVTFVTYFCFMGLEAALPPVANRVFGWSEVQTSYVYFGASILIIVVVVVLRILSSYFTDRTLLLAGLLVMVVSYVWLTVVVSLLHQMPQHAAISMLLLGIAVHVIGLPFTFAFSESLYTKLAPIADMDRAQSILRTVINVAFLVGPYVGGTLIERPVIVFLAMAMLSIVSLVLVVNRFTNFAVNDHPVSPSLAVEQSKEC